MRESGGRQQDIARNPALYAVPIGACLVCAEGGLVQAQLGGSSGARPSESFTPSHQGIDCRGLRCYWFFTHDFLPWDMEMAPAAKLAPCFLADNIKRQTNPIPGRKIPKTLNLSLAFSMGSSDSRILKLGASSLTAYSGAKMDRPPYRKYFSHQLNPAGPQSRSLGSRPSFYRDGLWPKIRALSS